jgi:hypothetical protein
MHGNTPFNLRGQVVELAQEHWQRLAPPNRRSLIFALARKSLERSLPTSQWLSCTPTGLRLTHHRGDWRGGPSRLLAQLDSIKRRPVLPNSSRHPKMIGVDTSARFITDRVAQSISTTPEVK